MSAPVSRAIVGPDEKQVDRLEEFAKKESRKDDAATQALLDRYRAKSLGGKVAGILPVGISFPTFGPSTFLVSELTAENQAPVADFTYQKDKKRGSR
jgi:hypothetical protein